MISVNNCYGFSHEAAPSGPEGNTMIVLMAALALFALLLGALNLVTGPVGLGMAAFIAAWLALFAARDALARRRAHASSR